MNPSREVFYRQPAIAAAETHRMLDPRLPGRRVNLELCVTEIPSEGRLLRLRELDQVRTDLVSSGSPSR
jgi:hypothetical protein